MLQPYIYIHSPNGKLLEKWSRFGRRTTEFDFGFSIWTTVLNFGLGSRTTVFIFALGSPTLVINFGFGSRTTALEFWLGSRTTVFNSGFGSQTKVLNFGFGSPTIAVTSRRSDSTFLCFLQFWLLILPNFGVVFYFLGPLWASFSGFR